MSLQEKFQITLPPAKEDEEDYVWKDAHDARARDNGGIEHCHENNATSDQFLSGKYNQLPPGMEMDNQLRVEPSHFVKGWGGNTDVSGKCVDLPNVHMGYTHLDMKGSDDQYTGEHVDHFYGVAYGTDDAGKKIEGFVERNNYLDRE